jgi:hypothetical protein
MRGTVTLAVVLGLAAGLLGIFAFTGLPGRAGVACPPVFIGTYWGEVYVVGQTAPDGTVIKALIDDVEWASTTTSDGDYLMDIPDHIPTEPPCFPGGTLTFKCDSLIAAETPTWSPGSHDLNLNCSSPVGGVAELPAVAGSSAPNYIALAGLAAAAALLALSAGAWYARRRWLR